MKPWFLSLSYSFPLNLPLSQSYGDAIHRGRPWEKDRKHLVEARSESDGVWTGESVLPVFWSQNGPWQTL